jgi:hypothetical protein
MKSTHIPLNSGKLHLFYLFRGYYAPETWLQNPQKTVTMDEVGCPGCPDSSPRSTSAFGDFAEILLR